MTKLLVPSNFCIAAGLTFQLIGIRTVAGFWAVGPSQINQKVHSERISLNVSNANKGYPGDDDFDWDEIEAMGGDPGFFAQGTGDDVPTEEWLPPEKENNKKSSDPSRRELEEMGGDPSFLGTSEAEPADQPPVPTETSNARASDILNSLSPVTEEAAEEMLNTGGTGFLTSLAMLKNEDSMDDDAGPILSAEELEEMGGDASFLLDPQSSNCNDDTDNDQNAWWDGQINEGAHFD